MNHACQKTDPSCVLDGRVSIVADGRDPSLLPGDRSAFLKVASGLVDDAGAGVEDDESLLMVVAGFVDGLGGQIAAFQMGRILNKRNRN